MSKVLDDLRENKIKFNINGDNKAKIYKDPKFFETIKYLYNTYLKLIKRFLGEKLFNKKIRWYVSYKSNEGLENLKLDDFKVIDNIDKNRFLADLLFLKK